MSFNLKINNENTANYSNSEVYLAVITRKVAGGAFYWYDLASKSLKEISTADNTHSISQYSPGSGKDTYANYFFKLSDVSEQTLSFSETLIGSRIYVSLGDWLPIKVNSSSAYSPPSPTNPVLPGYQTIFDKLELTYQPDANGTDTKKLYIDTTAVDFMGIPMTLQMGSETVGFSSTRAKLISAFTSKAATTYLPDLVVKNPAKSTEVLRILNPTGTANDMGLVIPQAAADYFAGFLTAYIDSVWKAYKSPQSLSIKIGADTYTGQVDDSDVFNFFSGSAASGTNVLALNKPPSSDVLGCRNSMASGNDVQKNIQKFLAAAMVRTVALESPGTGDAWCSQSAKYYTNAPVYEYANILHEHSHDKLCYAFSYDDVCDHSSTLKTNTPSVTLNLSAW